MEKAVSTSELIEMVILKRYGSGYRVSKVQRDEIARTIEFFADAITEVLQDGDNVNWRGMLHIEMRNRKARKGRNPKTGEIVTFPPSIVPVVKLSESLKSALKE